MGRNHKGNLDDSMISKPTFVPVNLRKIMDVEIDFSDDEVAE